MDVKKAIETRRSIRKYLDKDVPENIMRELIESARLAPSGNNAQPWKFSIVSDNKIKESFRKNNVFPQDWVYSSPAIIVCYSDPKEYKKNVEGIDDSNKIRALRDLSIASSYIVLRATELGLGTCYVGWRNEEKIKDILSIPEDYILPYVITVGYPDEKPISRPCKNIDEIVIKNTTLKQSD